MKKIVMLLSTFALAACQTSKTTNEAMNRDIDAGRTPSSAEATTEHSNEEMDNTYDILMRSQNPSAEFVSFLASLKSIFYRAEVRVRDFDEALKKNDEKEFDLMAMPEYQKVMVMRLVRDKVEDKIVAIYGRLRFVAASGDPTSADSIEAKKVLKAFDGNLMSSKKADEVIFQELKDRLAALGLKQIRKQARVTTTASFHQMALDLGSKEERKSDALAEQIQKTEETLKESAQSDRTPQSARIEPSTGPGGSISGNNFPSGVWALTYDDGPHPSYTMKDVANVQANGGKATFFWLAKNTGLYPNVVHGVQAAGLPIEDHSWNHPQLNSPKDIARMKSTLAHEIIDSAATETRQFGVKPRFFRCPYGAGINSPTVRQMIAAQGMVNVFWNVDSLDWQDHNPASILARTQKQMAAQKRGIILFHDIHPQSVEASRMLMQAQRGKVNWVTIPEIVDRLNGN